MENIDAINMLTSSAKVGEHNLGHKARTYVKKGFKLQLRPRFRSRCVYRCYGYNGCYCGHCEYRENLQSGLDLSEKKLLALLSINNPSKILSFIGTFYIFQTQRFRTAPLPLYNGHYTGIRPLFKSLITRLYSAAFGENGFFCAIDAGGEQQIICWDKTNKISSIPTFDFVPSMASLSGGEGFLCGITANNLKAFCLDLLDFGINLVPKAFKYNSYSEIAVGKSHVCAIKGSYFSSSNDFGNVDCWELD
ncbi:hypothetical protein PVK06_023651 [Gossypium arboreum]|uniref:non-specific serine/threonine protein kinase n=1 Tax=Gossypium arboreum TaxID=29729 RepID=A0ABR0PBR1_GOSAR|nr:hypothetical protein PVK06_023651 [Gossypium arboreum]